MLQGFQIFALPLCIMISLDDNIMMSLDDNVMISLDDNIMMSLDDSGFASYQQNKEPASLLPLPASLPRTKQLSLLLWSPHSSGQASQQPQDQVRGVSRVLMGSTNINTMYTCMYFTLCCIHLYTFCVGKWFCVH